MTFKRQVKKRRQSTAVEGGTAGEKKENNWPKEKRVPMG